MSPQEAAAKARAAKAAKATPPSEPPAEIVAFAVIQSPDGYRPMRIILHGTSAFEAVPLHEPMPYEALAYHYLANDVTAHYEAGTRSKARDAATLDRMSRDTRPLGR
jgi:hypothetical protein